jgi:predicted MPP superfamily phosphohydrolase
MIRFLHLSDLHFHSDPARNAAVAALLQSIAADYPDHHLLITGDITDDGGEAQCENACAALLPFRGRVWLVPGNHDYGPFGNFYDETCARRFDRFLATPFDLPSFAEGDVPSVKVLETPADKVLLIGLNSNLRTMDPFDFACGEIGESQRARLAQILSNSRHQSRLKIVYLHHHPFYHNPFFRLLDSEAFLRVVFNRADVLAFGHKHVAGLWQGAPGVPWIVAAEDSPGRATVREISLDARQIEVRDVPVRISP